MEQRAVSKQVRCCKEEGLVHCLSWHPTDGTTLLVGTSKGTVHVIDCNQPQDVSKKRWQLEGAIEKVMWVSAPADATPNADNICYILVSCRAAASNVNFPL